MSRSWAIPVLIIALLLGGVSSASASPPARVITSAVSNVASNVFSALVKWLWTLQSTPKTEVSSRSMMKFEGGYTVETVFDGSKLGIEPHSIEVSPDGELLVLDSDNSNIYKISIPFSRHSRPKLIAGSPEGLLGHVDGWTREARLNHPKGLAVDDRGNIYIADAMNMAIRKISDSGISTIAGGKWSRGGGHVDGPSEDAKFSNDFDVFYAGISCSLYVVDRGNQAIREIQLHHDDCSSHEVGSSSHEVGSSFHLERRVAGLKKRHEDLRSELEVANLKLEEAKRCRETAEHELKGYEVELALNESAVQSLQARNNTIQDQISAVKSDIEEIKNKDSFLRDEFINKMFEINDSMRKFVLKVSHHFAKEDPEEDNLGDSESKDQFQEEEIQAIPGMSLDDKLDYIVSHTKVEEEMLQAEQDLQKQLKQEAIDLEKRIVLMEAITNGTRDLHELTRQSSELEQKCGQVVEELQRRSVCPRCHQDNVDALKDILQGNEEAVSM